MFCHGGKLGNTSIGGDGRRRARRHRKEKCAFRQEPVGTGRHLAREVLTEGKSVKGPSPIKRGGTRILPASKHSPRELHVQQTTLCRKREMRKKIRCEKQEGDPFPAQVFLKEKGRVHLTLKGFKKSFQAGKPGPQRSGSGGLKPRKHHQGTCTSELAKGDVPKKIPFIKDKACSRDGGPVLCLGKFPKPSKNNLNSLRRCAEVPKKEKGGLCARKREKVQPSPNGGKTTRKALRKID